MIRILINAVFYLCFVVALTGLVGIVMVSMVIRLVWWLFTLPVRILEGRKWA